MDAIFEATIQVLLIDGHDRLTTTRVAERAGVSVGTMYQYFPHKQALLYAVLESFLELTALSVEEASGRFAGAGLVEMSDGLVNTFLDAKMRQLPGSRALYAVASYLDSADLIDHVVERIHVALKRLLASASDASFDDIESVSLALLSMMGGSVRTFVERDTSPGSLAVLRAQLPVMARSYLLASARQRDVR
ncbi:MAG: TetR/AcrR family transcriptional regulator [Luteibacter sp.]